MKQIRIITLIAVSLLLSIFLMNCSGQSPKSDSDNGNNSNNAIEPPSNLSATIIGLAKINLTWQNNSNNEQGFKIERGEVEDDFYYQIGVVSANITAFCDTEVEPYRLLRYSYRVRAYNKTSNSNYSNTFEIEKNLTEEEKIIYSFVQGGEMCEAKTSKMLQERQTHIKALVGILDLYKKSTSELGFVPGGMGIVAESAINLLGELRASESVDSIIDFILFVIKDRRESSGGWEKPSGLDALGCFMALSDDSQNALSKIGNPAVLPLINLLKNEIPNPEKIQFTKDAIEDKNQFAIKTLYQIEGEFLIYHLEKNLGEETDSKKIETLSEVIDKLKEEIKSGVYKDHFSTYRQPAPK
jgi:hypothetical protein